MLATLAAAEAELPALLEDAAAWNSLHIDYHPPVVERMWRPWRDVRVSLHRIHPCAPGEALLHPHPWPSAILVVSGTYEMGVTYGAGTLAPPLASKVVLAPGSRYEMIDPDGWHYVRPLGAPSLSLMVTGKPWSRAMPVEPEQPLVAMRDDARASLLAAFRAAFSVAIRLFP